MPRRPARFTSREITKAIKGFADAGISPNDVKVELEQNGKIVVTVRPNGAVPPDSENDFGG